MAMGPKYYVNHNIHLFKRHTNYEKVKKKKKMRSDDTTPVTKLLFPDDSNYPNPAPPHKPDRPARPGHPHNIIAKDTLMNRPRPATPLALSQTPNILYITQTKSWDQRHTTTQTVNKPGAKIYRTTPPNRTTT